MRIRSIVLAAALAVGGLGLSGATADAGVSVGPACGGAFVGSDTCTFTTTVGLVTVELVGVGAVGTQVRVDLIGPGGEVRTMCQQSLFVVGACAPSTIVPFDWAGHPLTCSVRVESLTDPTVVLAGAYLCKGV